jgi:hypothetical protein
MGVLLVEEGQDVLAGGNGKILILKLIPEFIEGDDGRVGTRNDEFESRIREQGKQGLLPAYGIIGIVRRGVGFGDVARRQGRCARAEGKGMNQLAGPPERADDGQEDARVIANDENGFPGLRKH